jgi:hypothetical protein
MNSIIATLVRQSPESTSVDAYGNKYCSIDAVVPSSSNSNEVKLRLLCYEAESPKLQAFVNWEPGKRYLVSGDIVFNEDTKKPLDVIVERIFTEVEDGLYVNEVVLGNAFFARPDYKPNRNGEMLSTKIGSSLDNSDTVTWLFMETYKARETKLKKYIRKGRPVCVKGYLREYHSDPEKGPYRAIVASSFTVRKDKERKREGNGQYDGVDPSPQFSNDDF